jgi:cytochrome c553
VNASKPAVGECRIILCARDYRGMAASRSSKYFDCPAVRGRPVIGRFVYAVPVMVALLMIWSAASAQTPETPKAPDTTGARARACAPCHGARGEGTDNDYFPRLAGKPAGYLTNQLIAFRDGQRRYAPMNYLLEYQTDAYLQKIAAYLSALRPPPQPPAVTDASSAVLARGKTLVIDGDQAHGVPACSRCHGPKLTGMEPGIPGLVGLHASYISAQLGEFRYGTRTAPSPDCMQLVAASLTEGDVAAVAAYLASQPVPADPSPVPHGTLAMPLVCGSEPH